jgi:hypothetical protein
LGADGKGPRRYRINEPNCIGFEFNTVPSDLHHNPRSHSNANADAHFNTAFHRIGVTDNPNRDSR